MADQQYVECTPGRGVSTHSRCVGGHPRHRDPYCIGTIVQKAGNRLHRNVARHDVAVDKGDVTGGSIGRDAVFGPEVV